MKVEKKHLGLRNMTYTHVLIPDILSILASSSLTFPFKIYFLYYNVLVVFSYLPVHQLGNFQMEAVQIVAYN